MHLLGPNNDLSGGQQLTFCGREFCNLLDTTKGQQLPPAFDLQKRAIHAFDELSSLFRSADTGLPLPVDSVTTTSPSLRYSGLYPPVPRSHLGASAPSLPLPDLDARTGAPLTEPLSLHLRLAPSSRWPDDLPALAAARCAFLLRLADFVEGDAGRRAGFAGPCVVSASALDFGYAGYAWRAEIWAEQELKILGALDKPTEEAEDLRKTLHRKFVAGSKHHGFVKAVHVQWPAAASTTRLAMRWVHAHMLSGMLPQEAVEMMVAKVFGDDGGVQKSPNTVWAGFWRFLDLLGNFDWVGCPLVVDPQGHFSSEDVAKIQLHFSKARGEDNSGPPMYIISPHDDSPGGTLAPTYTQTNPEWVVLTRASALARISCDHLHSWTASCLDGTDPDESGAVSSWTSLFRESPAALCRYDVLLRVHRSFVADPGASSVAGDFGADTAETGALTPFHRSLVRRCQGPRELRKKSYKNLNSADALVRGWRPVSDLVALLRARYGRLALFFYNDLAPEVVGVLWRPAVGVKGHVLAARTSAHVRPLAERSADSLVATNQDAVLQEIRWLVRGVVEDVVRMEKGKVVTGNYH
mmetsp:Transcript_5372/g.11079  ORF Transcript_5372/g.11079 Transcript_5372/m.11079 type:complete len:581 (-) Transcript_5372:163-1905(-)